jgi:cbb3-type cytochrome oxidase subunit 3
MLIDLCAALGIHPFQLFFLSSMSILIVLLVVFTFTRERKNRRHEKR